MSLSARIPRTFTISAVTLAALLAAACRGGEHRASDSAAGTAAPADTTSRSTASTGGGPTLNDAQIAHAAVTANSIDSAAGAQARPKARNADVRDFAQMMVRDHGAVNKQAVALAQRLNVTPEDNDMSRQLQQGATDARNNLQGKSGTDFDRAYIDHEVEFHQAVLDALDKTLIPQAQNADLKALLQQVRPNVAAHLERAKQIQGKLTQS